ncbi:hypothetical protein SSX86_023148 [Deinandra increscens subsp. villosa]|uniref:RNA-directed DNA polymerase n=1 Tax=Deinandra increscens subsp. villosa TaxID=3103831 RepID=A0AAP0CQB2_9ASTR
MPPRRDPSPTPDHSALANKLDQLVAASTQTNQLLATSNSTANDNSAQLAALLKATETLTTKILLNHDTTTMLSNHIQTLITNLNNPSASNQTTSPQTTTASSSTQPPIPPMLTGATNPPPPTSPLNVHHPNPNISTSIPPQTSPMSLHHPPQNQPIRPPVTITAPPQQPRSPKISLPLFDGSNPLDWIFQADNFFNYYQTPIAQRISLSVFYFTGEALSWYKHLATNEMLGTWATFKREVEIRFGPSSYENHEAALFKLRQTSTVSEFQAEFEKLSNRVNGLSQQTLKNCFISGLRRDIQNELALLKPISLNQAYGQARLVEEKLGQVKPKSSFSFKSSSTFPSVASSSTNLSRTLTTSSTSSTTPSLPFTRLTPEAMQQRRKDGLCFRCPEKYVPGHKCSPPQFLLIVDNEDDDGLESDAVVTSPPEISTTPQFLSLSNAAYFGLSSTQTLRVTGHIAGKPVTILVDCGSTHNIIQPRVASSLNLSTETIPSFTVMVGNGEHIPCSGYCPNVSVQLRKANFTIPFYILPVEGADVILGIAWLGTLGRLSADFSIPEISFKLHGEEHTLTGDPLTQPVSPSSLSSLIRHNSIASLHTLIYQPTQTHLPSTLPLTHPNTHIQQLLTEFATLFQSPHSLPPNRVHDHNIPLLNENKPINVKPYRYPHFQKKIMTDLIKEMLTDGVIQPSQSPFSSPVLLVKKKDGSWRFCVDYRALNAVTVRDRFPIPTIDELLDELHGATVFSKIDLRSGYHQIRVAKNDIHKTAFRTSDGHYEFLVMPFGLTNAPSTFQAAMNDIFRPVLRKFVLVFFDDILVYSPSEKSHLDHLRYVFQTLLENHYYAKPSKCMFAASSISFLGHQISHEGVAPEQEKIDTIQQWPKPTSFTALRAFLGLTGYYRRFVPNYAKIASPLTDLLKNKEFSWSIEAQAAFDDLKKHMHRLVTLALPDFNSVFDVTTDASGTAIGAVLSQNNRPLSFFSKKLCHSMQTKSTYTKELYAITESVKKWRQYLLGSRFRVYTDHHSLKHLLTQTIQTPEQQKWLTKLMGYDFEIHYKPGKENMVADALSRVNQPALHALSVPQATWIKEIRDYFASNPNGKELVHKIQTDLSTFPHHTVRNGLVYVRDRILVPPIPKVRENLLEEFHASPVGGHSGIQATTRRLSSSFSWLGLKKDVTTFIRNCQVCQSTKPTNHKPYGLLQPLPIPEAPWLDISMDFITHLPCSRGKTAIWVIVDRFSKFAHFIALPKTYTAVSLASTFLREIYRLHGLPNSILSDRDPLFLSRFWKELFKQLGTKLLHSSAYHPSNRWANRSSKPMFGILLASLCF